MAASAERLSVGSRPRPSRPPQSSSMSRSRTLELLLLLRDRDPARYGRAALRWHARYCREVPGVSLNEAAAVLALLSALADADGGAPRALAELFHGRELDQPARILIEWADGERSGRP